MRTELEEFKYPNRRPWLLLVVVAVVGLFFLLRHGRSPVGESEETPASAGAGEERAETGAHSGLTPRQQFSVSGRVGSGAVNAVGMGASGDLLGARRSYLEGLGQATDEKTRRDIEDRLGRVNTELVLNPHPMPEKEEYVVRRGDSLDRIARKTGTTIDLIQRSNKLANPNVIKIGDRLRIMSGKFTIEISKERRDLLLKLNGKFFKRYPIGIGKFDKTPEGTFVVTDKEKEPVWWPQGREVPYGHPDNVLGTRWMAIKATGETPAVRGYGIHGTWEDASIGKAESAGCIRMLNTDVEEIFTLVPSGTPVVITK